jgi:hypothetical protein
MGPEGADERLTLPRNRPVPPEKRYTPARKRGRNAGGCGGMAEAETAKVESAALLR